jgi:hypothetical protein
MVKHYTCIICKKRVKPTDRRPISDPIRKYIQKQLAMSCSENDVACGACRIKLHKNKQKSLTHTSTHTTSNDKDADYIPQPSTSKQFFSPPSVSNQVQSLT